MTKRTREIVQLPASRLSVPLPLRLAKALRLIVEAGQRGASSILLSGLGCASIHTTIIDLRKEGAIIEVRRGLEKDGTGAMHSGIAFYIYRGWAYPCSR